MWVTEKILIRAAANLFFYRFFGDSLFFFFWFLFFSFVCLFVCLMLFRIKNVYSDTHSTMGAVEWWKNFHPTDFRKQDYFFWPYYSLLFPNKIEQVRNLYNIFMLLRNQFSVPVSELSLSPIHKLFKCKLLNVLVFQTSQTEFINTDRKEPL